MKRLSLPICLGLCVLLLTVVWLGRGSPQAEAASVAALVSNNLESQPLYPLGKSLLFTDDFESGTGKWTLVTGVSQTLVDGTTVYSTTYSGTFARTIVSNTAAFGWTNYAVTARIKPTAMFTTSGSAFASLFARYIDTNNHYIMALKPDTPSVVLYRRYNGSTSGRTLGTCSGATEPLCNISLNTWYTPTLELNGNVLIVYMGGTPVLTVTDNSTEVFYTGTIGIGGQRISAEFDDVVVTDLNNYTLTVTTTGTGSGSVSSVPSGIDCGVTCTASFESGTVVTLTATPSGNSIFAGWSGACSGTGDCVVTMNAAKSVIAAFALPGQLSVNKAGDGSGLVTSIPDGINCGLTCTATFNQGTVITLTPTANSDSKFAGWGGACSGTAILPTNECILTMSASQNVTATFMLAAYPLTVTLSGNGTGTVSSIPAGISCGPTCTASFDSGSVVTLTATPTSDSLFTGWGGACPGSGTAVLPANQCVVTMDAAKSVNATFMLSTQTLTVGKLGSGTGIVTSIPAGVDCGITCSAGFAYNSVVTLTATPASDSTFEGWGGVCTGLGLCVTTMNTARSVTATFAYDRYTLPFTDDFESGLGKWIVQAGTWTAGTDGTQVYSQTNPSVTARSYTGSTAWTNYALRARVKPLSGQYVMLMARYQDNRNYYFMTLRTDRNQIEIKKMVAGSSGSALRTVPYSVTIGTWYTPTFEVVGSEMRGYINGTLVITATDPGTTAPFVSGRVGVGTSNALAEFDDVLVSGRYYIFLPVVLRN